MNLEKYMLPCLSKTIFGIECLGCGFQRALLLLIQGNLTEAFKMYPAVYSSILFIACCTLGFLDKKRKYSNLIITTGIINGVFMIVGYYFKHFESIFLM
ncbi:DUF2752 domain-containing protein [Flavobacterium sp. SOK18b]|uniref:DUF2752 domain-containing protein n=1 Tax=Flavobacterium sp. SOK18b TaxID=797900 RepID=UPI0021069619|nr:DUF2752 domain-containing protein [Flavobacterium sp. SOK18b]